MKLVIIESPYAGIYLRRNIAYAKEAIHHSLKLDEAPLASHLLYTQPGILRDDEPAERKLGIAAGLAWYRVADTIAFYIDHGWSPGMRDALARAKQLHKSFEYRAIL